MPPFRDSSVALSLGEDSRLPMNDHDAITDPTASISATELRRRLLASAPPSALGEQIPDPAIGQSGIQSMPALARSRLLMPGANGPVAAESVPPVVEPAPIPEVHLPSRQRFMSSDTPSAMNLGGSVLGPMPGHLPAVESEQPPVPSGGKPPDDFKRVKQENRELRKLLEEMKQLLQEASDNEQKFATREAALMEQLATHQRQTEELSSQLQGIEEQLASGALTAAPPTPKTRTELEEWTDELEQEAAKLNKLRRELDDERRQLREDEQALEQQMRQMEVSMAKERALMARQEIELKRLSSEIQQELELMQRGDATLREQLSKFQRRATDVMQGKMGQSMSSMPGIPPSGNVRR